MSMASVACQTATYLFNRFNVNSFNLQLCCTMLFLYYAPISETLNQGQGEALSNVCLLVLKLTACLGSRTKSQLVPPMSITTLYLTRSRNAKIRSTKQTDLCDLCGPIIENFHSLPLVFPSCDPRYHYLHKRQQGPFGATISCASGWLIPQCSSSKGH